MDRKKTKGLARRRHTRVQHFESSKDRIFVSCFSMVSKVFEREQRGDCDCDSFLRANQRILPTSIPIQNDAISAANPKVGANSADPETGTAVVSVIDGQPHAGVPHPWPVYSRASMQSGHAVPHRSGEIEISIDGETVDYRRILGADQWTSHRHSRRFLVGLCRTSHFSNPIIILPEALTIREKVLFLLPT